MYSYIGFTVKIALALKFILNIQTAYIGNKPQGKKIKSQWPNVDNLNVTIIIIIPKGPTTEAT